MAVQGKTIIFLGSSVTYGAASGGKSFVEYMAETDGILPVKEAVSGTLLVDESRDGGASYIARMKELDTTIKADAFMCQLSTNDAYTMKPLGQIAETCDKESFDVHTVAGAIEYIIAYAKETWNCPVYFYTGTKYESERYCEMVQLMKAIAEKWQIEVLNLWDDPEMDAVSKEDYDSYMADGVHPNWKGYSEWWGPKFRAFFAERL